MEIHQRGPSCMNVYLHSFISKLKTGASSIFLPLCRVPFRYPSSIMCVREPVQRDLTRALQGERNKNPERWGKHINLVKLNADPHPSLRALPILLFPFPTQIMCSAHSEKSANFRPLLSLAYQRLLGWCRALCNSSISHPPPLSPPLSLSLVLYLTVSPCNTHLIFSRCPLTLSLSSPLCTHTGNHVQHLT